MAKIIPFVWFMVAALSLLLGVAGVWTPVGAIRVTGAALAGAFFVMGADAAATAWKKRKDPPQAPAPRITAGIVQEDLRAGDVVAVDAAGKVHKVYRPPLQKPPLAAEPRRPQ